MLNCGFPIDFDDRLNTIPDDMIQMTMALMVLGAVQAATTQDRGHVPLDRDHADSLIRSFYEKLKGKPYFRLLDDLEYVLARNREKDANANPYAPFDSGPLS